MNNTEWLILKKKIKKKFQITLVIILMLFCVIWIWIYNEINKTPLDLSTSTSNQPQKLSELLVIFNEIYIDLNSLDWVEKSRIFWEKYDLKYAWSFKWQNMVSFKFMLKTWDSIPNIMKMLENLDEVKFVQQNFNYNIR